MAVSVAESVATAVAKSRVSKGGVSTAVSKTVSSVAPQARVAESRVAVSVVGISLSISLGLGLGLTLAVVATRVASVAESGVSNARVSTAVAKTISVSSIAPQARVAKTGVAVSVVGISLSIGISLGLSLSLTLAVVATGVASVAESVATAVSESGVSEGGVSTAVSKAISVSSIAPQARVAKTGVSVSVVGISL